MSSRFFWRPLAGAMLVALPALALVPGCGGGSSSNNVYSLTGVEVRDGSTLLTTGNLSINYNTSSSSTQSVTGYLQIIGDSNSATPTPTTTATTRATATPTVTVTPTVRATAVALKTRALPGDFTPGGATYQFKGTATLSSTGSPVLNVTGAFAPLRPFTITGTFAVGSNLTLTSSLLNSNGQTTGTGTLTLLVLSKPITGATAVPTVTATGTAAATPTTNPTGTPGATLTATPIGTTTATPLFTPIPTVTPVPTLTSIPTVTPIPTSTFVPVR